MYIGFGMPGLGEWIVILVIVVIFFGVGRLPDVLGQMGKGVKAFKDGMSGDDDRQKRSREIDVTPADEIKQSTGDKTTSA